MMNDNKTLLVSVHIDHFAKCNVDEFYLLAISAGAEVIQHLEIHRHKAEAKYFIGSGKVEEIADLVQQHDIDLVIFEQTLTPAQERNLEQAFQCRVLDRTRLILDIFALRARTYEGQLQVEVAQLEYISARLVRGYTHLSSQKGGIGLRGPGETQLETDRRLLRIRLQQLKEKLKKVQQTRQQGRMARQKNTIPTVSLVGYTNAGKSTLFNRLADSHVYAENQLFATLDPTLRRMDWVGIGSVVLADTVGFVSQLSHSLVESFKATLEETVQSTLLLHVIDSSSDEMLEQIDTVEQVLQDIGADVPIIRVYNKIDRTGEPVRVHYHADSQLPERVYVSAHTGQGIDELLQVVQEYLAGKSQLFDLSLDYQHARLQHRLFELGAVQQQYYDEHGRLHLQVNLAPNILVQTILQHHIALDDVLGERAKDFKPVLEEFEQ